MIDGGGAKTTSGVALVAKIDWQRVQNAFKQVGEAWDRAAKQAARALKQMSRMIHCIANDEVHVSGLEARYYVRGGLLCEDIDSLVQTLLRNPGAAATDEDDRLLLGCLTNENRVRLAVAAIAGHVVHNEVPPTGLLPAHRWLAGTAVVVR
jgi:hypothetical protein